MSCFGRHSHKYQEALEQARREIEQKLILEGWQVIEAQDLGHSIVFKIRKKKGTQ